MSGKAQRGKEVGGLGKDEKPGMLWEPTEERERASGERKKGRSASSSLLESSSQGDEKARSSE